MYVLMCSSRGQEEKEALDDLSMELELADEDEPILYIPPFIVVLSSLTQRCITDTASANLSCTCPCSAP